jgi:hypothetical protein
MKLNHCHSAECVQIVEALTAKATAYMEMMDANAKELDRLMAERKPLTDEQKDAARYQHIKGMAQAMSLDINGNHYWRMSLHGIRGPSLDEAIDRAIEAAHGITKGTP